MTPIAYPLMLLLAATGPAPEKTTAVNFAHIDHLTERIQLGSDTVNIVHIYSNYPDYRWIGAAESGPEGIACVDDAARAAVMFMRSYELRADTASLRRSRGLLEFVMHMQAEDGEFYNFVHADHTVNRDGKTSFKSFGWWAVRGLWAMAAGARVFRTSDPLFSRRLEERVSRMIPLVGSSLNAYGMTRVESGFAVPGWLLYESGADVTSELLLGLCEYRKIRGGDSLRTLLMKLARGLLIMQDGDERTPPYGLHRSWETTWHMWGNAQTQALSTAGLMLRDTSMISSSVREARGWYGRLLMDGFLKEMDLSKPSPAQSFDQIAYGVRPMAVGLLRLYDATRDSEYLAMAGLAASWLFGNNPARRAMYDPATGRCYDGIRDSLTLNLNSGAESTIEALYTLVEVEQYPAAAKFLSARKVCAGSTAAFSYARFRGEPGTELTLVREIATGRFSLYEGERSRVFRAHENIP